MSQTAHLSSPITMALDHSRRRLVTFRLKDNEYESVKAVCAEQGIRSISEFARRGVLYQVTRQEAARANFADDLTTLTVRLQELDSALKEASSQIARLLGKQQCEV